MLDCTIFEVKASFMNETMPHISIGGIIVLCHFHKNDLMPMFICKNDKNLVTLYNVIFANMTGILSYLSYNFYQHKMAAMCH